MITDYSSSFRVGNENSNWSSKVFVDWIEEKASKQQDSNLRDLRANLSMVLKLQGGSQKAFGGGVIRFVKCFITWLTFCLCFIWVLTQSANLVGSIAPL